MRGQCRLSFDRGADRGAVLIEQRRGAHTSVARSPSNCSARPHRLAPALLRAVDRHDEPEVRDLRILDDGVDAVDGRERHVAVAQPLRTTRLAGGCRKRWSSSAPSAS